MIEGNQHFENSERMWSLWGVSYVSLIVKLYYDSNIQYPKLTTNVYPKKIFCLVISFLLLEVIDIVSKKLFNVYLCNERIKNQTIKQTTYNSDI